MSDKTEEMRNAIHKGVTEGFSNKLMNTDISDPRPIWMAPISEEAVPAFFENGASVSAAVLGFAIPTQDKRRKMKMMLIGKSSQPICEAIINNSEMTTYTGSIK